MRPWTIQALFLLALVSANRAHAHIGDEIYPFYEILDEDLERIDLTDGSVEDWFEVLGEPSLTASDFSWPFSEYDPSSLDNRFWLAWNRSSGTLWVAMERFDDVYFNRYEGQTGESGFTDMLLWDSYLTFMVDGDHSGGRYWFTAENCEDCTEEEAKLMNNRHAQHWMAIAEAPDGDHVAFGGAGQWVAGESYAAAGGGVLGRSPATTVTEMKVTPFDDLIYNDEAASEASALYPGKIIGFDIHTIDNDATEFSDGMGPTDDQQLSGRWRAFLFADLFVDGLLVGAGEDPSAYDGDDGSAVEPSSWARIKAALQ